MKRSGISRTFLTGSSISLLDPLWFVLKWSQTWGWERSPPRPQTAVIHPVSQRALQRSWPSQHSLLPCIISSVFPRGYLTKRRSSPAHLLLNISFLLPVGQWFDLHDVCSCRVQMWALLSCMSFTKSCFFANYPQALLCLFGGERLEDLHSVRVSKQVC